MISHTLKFTRPALRLVRVVPRRNFVVTPARKADLVKDLYIKELSAYKTPEVKSSDAEGQVQKFVKPATPKSPEESDIAGDLKAYEAQSVETEGQAVTEDGAAPVQEDWLEPIEEDEPAAAH